MVHDSKRFSYMAVRVSAPHRGVSCCVNIQLKGQRISSSGNVTNELPGIQVRF